MGGHITKHVVTGIQTRFDAFAHATQICHAMSKEPPPFPHIFILIHNIEGQGLSARDAQNALGRLAKHPRIHILASIDHLNAYLRWDRALLEAFAWVKIEAPTYVPYTTETAFDKPLVSGDQTSSRAKGIRHVLDSLTPNHV